MSTIGIDNLQTRLTGGFRSVLDNPTEEAMGLFWSEINSEMESYSSIDKTQSGTWWRAELQRLMGWFIKYPSKEDYSLIDRRCKQYMEVVDKDTFKPIKLFKTQYDLDKDLWFTQELNARISDFIGEPTEERLVVLLKQMDRYLEVKEVA